MTDEEKGIATAQTKTGNEPWLAVPQKYLGTVGLIALLAIANLLIPFSVDIYTPSLPEMPGYFHTTESVVNLTLVLFYVFFAVALLLFGTLSDKTGRKIVLLVGKHRLCRGNHRLRHVQRRRFSDIACMALSTLFWALYVKGSKTA